MSVNDNGNTGSGGALVDSDSVSITVAAVNDPPVVTVPAAQTVDEDTDLVLTGIAVADPDAASGSVTVTLAVQHGTLSFTALTGGASIAGDGSSSLTLTGTLAQINATLSGSTLVYRGDANFNGSDTLTVTADDNGNIGDGGPQSDTKTVAITITPVNDPPLVTVPDAQAVDEDTDQIGRAHV